MKQNKHKKNVEDTLEIEPNISLIIKGKQYNKKLEYSRYKDPKHYLIERQKQKQSNCGKYYNITIAGNEWGFVCILTYTIITQG